jgi:hypothetical protein
MIAARMRPVDATAGAVAPDRRSARDWIAARISR